MQTYKRLLGATTLGLILAAGLAAPAFAQKLDNKTGPSTLTTTAAGDIDFGDDSSEWANDGECDDLRFFGEGTDKKLLTDDLYGDATDCKALEAAGKVSIRKVYSPAYAAGADLSPRGDLDGARGG